MIFNRSDKYSDVDGLNYDYGAKSIGLRASIDHCELVGIIKGLKVTLERINLLKNIEVKLPKHLICIIDSETVLKWIGGKYFIKDPLIREKVKIIYDLLSELDFMDIITHLVWVKSHNDESGNELADDIAKLAMLNLYKTKDWKTETYVFSSNE